MMPEETRPPRRTFRERYDEIRQNMQHNKFVKYVQDNQNMFIGIGGGFVAGYFIHRSMPEMKTVVDAYKIQWKSPTTNNVTTTLVRRGHPGYIVKCIETGEVFASQARAADAMGINRPNLVSHLHGRIPSVNGYTFEKLGEALA